MLKHMANATKGAIKGVLFQKLVRKSTVVVKDVENNLLQGKHALITGGTSGIGEAIARKMAACGARVTVIGRNQARAEKIAADLQGDFLLVDLANTQAMLDTVQDYLKHEQVDILVNSAGVLDKEPWLHKTISGYDQVMDTNLKAIYFLCQTLANHMIDNGIKGHILNISSSSSQRPSWGPYQLSKRALNGLTLGLAQRLAPHGITVNGIAPGVTATPMMKGVLETDSLTYDNPMRRAQAPEEIANLAVFLASELGNSVIGDTIMMTGGSGNLSIDT